MDVKSELYTNAKNLTEGAYLACPLGGTKSNSMPSAEFEAVAGEAMLWLLMSREGTNVAFTQ